MTDKMLKDTLSTYSDEQLAVKLTEWERGFIKDVAVRQEKPSFEGFTDKQSMYVTRILQKLSGEFKEPEPVVVVGLNKIVDMMHFAMVSMKFPKVRFTLDGVTIQLSVAGRSSKNFGAINVTDGRPFGQNQFYGCILTNGIWSPSPTTPKKVVDFISELAQDPQAGASKYGKLTQHCCFCQSGLTDPKSLAVGYGPVCAKRYGMVWGDQELDQAKVLFVVAN